MWRYEVKDESTGKTVVLTFDHEPTQAEINARIEDEVWESDKGFLEQAATKPPALAVGIYEAFQGQGASMYGLAEGINTGAAGILRRVGFGGELADSFERSATWYKEHQQAAEADLRRVERWAGQHMPESRGTRQIGKMTGTVLPMLAPPALVARALGTGATVARGAGLWKTLSSPVSLTVGATSGAYASADYLRDARAKFEMEATTEAFKEKYPNITQEDIELMALGQAAPWAILSGAKTAGITMAGGVIGGKWLGTGGPESIAAEQIAARGASGGGLFGQIAARGASRAGLARQFGETGMQGLAQVGKVGVVESIEELIDESVQIAIDKYTKDEDMGWGEALERAGTAVAAGFVFGSAMHGAARSDWKDADKAWSAESKADLERIVQNSAGKAMALKLSYQFGIEPELPPTTIEQGEAARVSRAADILRRTQEVRNLEEEMASGELLTTEKKFEQRQRLESIKKAEELVPDVPTRKFLDEMGVGTVKEAYDMIIRGETPAQLKFVEEAVTNLEAKQEAEVEVAEEVAQISKEMDEEVLAGPKREFQQKEPLRRTTNDMLNIKSSRAAKDARAAEEALVPDFTGPTAVADAGPSVGRPDVPSAEADLSFLTGPESPLTGRQKAVLSKAADGKLLTGEEVKVRDEALRILEESKPQPKSKSTKEMGKGVLKGPITKAERELLKRGEEGELKRGEHWSLKRLKKKLEKIRASRRGRLLTSILGGADQAVITAGLEAAIVATNAGMKVDEALESAVKAMEDAGFHISKVNHNDAKREMAGKLSDRISHIELEEIAALQTGKPFKATKAKLKKVRDSLRKYRKGGRTNMGGIDIGGAAVLDAAFTVALKALEAGDTISVAMRKAYDSLGSPDVSMARFEGYMSRRISFAMDELEKGVSLEDVVKSSGLPFGGMTADEMIEARAEVEEGKKNGIPPPTTEIANLGKWWERGLGFFMGKGTADIMQEGENSLAFMNLGARMNDHVSQSDAYAGRLQAMLLDSGEEYIHAGNWFYESFGRIYTDEEGKIQLTQETKEQQQASIDFEEYQKALFRDKTPSDISGYSKLGQSLIVGWRNVAEYTGDIMVENGLMVLTAKGGKREFKKLGKNFWMRSYKPRFAKALWELKRGDEMNDTIQEIGDILIKHKEIDNVTVDDVFEWYNRDRLTKSSLDFTGYAEQDAFFDFLGRGREKGEPIEEMMDFSFEAAKRYIFNWSERMAQINAYGQALKEKGGKDLFQIAIDKFNRDNNTAAKELVEDMRKAAYQQEETRYWAKSTQFANKVATLLMLTGGFNAIRNLTGAGVTTTVFGVQNSLKAFKQMKDYAEAAKQARAWGVLRNDISLLLAGQEAGGAGKMDAATRSGLALSGFTGAENFVRIHAALTASVFAVEGVGAVKSGKTKLANEFKRMAERLEVDWKAIVKEDSSKGEVTQDFIRRAVKEVQGGYRFNQLPAFMSNPIGKFMFKFGAYSMQVGRAMKRNVLDEALPPSLGGHSNVAPLLRMLAMVGGSGEALYELRRLLFGTEKPHASFAEIMKSDDKLRLVVTRLVNDITYAGTLGYVSDVIGLLKDVTTQQRVKNPLDPAGAETPNQLIKFITKPFYTKEPYTVDDIDHFLTSVSATYRYGSKFAKEQAGNIGIEWDAAELKRAVDDRNMLRTATRRFQESVGADVKNLISQPEYVESEYTAEYRKIKDALLIGDVFAARDSALAFAKDLPEESRGKAWSRVSGSIHGSQPLKVGYSTSRKIKEEFIEWARRNLPEDEFNRMMIVQDRYMATAADAGLITAADDSIERDMKIRMNLQTPSVGRRKRSGPPKEWEPPINKWIREQNKRERDLINR